MRNPQAYRMLIRLATHTAVNRTVAKLMISGVIMFYLPLSSLSLGLDRASLLGVDVHLMTIVDVAAVDRIALGKAEDDQRDAHGDGNRCHGPPDAGFRKCTSKGAHDARRGEGDQPGD